MQIFPMTSESINKPVKNYQKMINKLRFMWTLHSKDPDHWIPISTVSSFKRMREFSAHGNEWLVNAIKLSDFLQVDETGTKLRRTTEPQEAKNQLERSVYAVSPDTMFPPPLQSAQYLNRKASVMRIRRSNAVWKNSSNNMDQLVPCA